MLDTNDDDIRRITERDLWWLEDGVAWVMTKNLVEVIGADTDSFAPSLRFHADGSVTTTGRREDEAWRQLYLAMLDGSVRTYAQNQKDLQEWGVVNPAILKNMKWHATEDYVTLRKVQAPTDGTSDLMRPLKLSAKDLITKFPESDGPLDLTSEEYEPGMVRPVGDGQMTFSDAALWAATDGGQRRIFLGKEAAWRDPVKAMVDAITSGRIRASGRKNGVAPQVRIDGVTFGGLLVQYPHVMPVDLSFALREVAFLKLCGPQLPEDEWQAGDTDKIILQKSTTDRPLYTHILLEKSDVAGVFPCLGKAPIVESSKPKTKGGGKKARIIAVLAKKFDGKKVPEPALAPRNTLQSDIENADKTLGSISQLTLRKAIEAYNAKAK